MPKTTVTASGLPGPAAAAPASFRPAPGQRPTRQGRFAAHHQTSRLAAAPPSRPYPALPGKNCRLATGTEVSDPGRAASPRRPGRVRPALQRPPSAPGAAAGTSAAGAWPHRRFQRPNRAQAGSRRPGQRVPQSGLEARNARPAPMREYWHGTGFQRRRQMVPDRRRLRVSVDERERCQDVPPDHPPGRSAREPRRPT
jgi:hypothetical protein